MITALISFLGISVAAIGTTNLTVGGIVGLIGGICQWAGKGAGMVSGAKAIAGFAEHLLPHGAEHATAEVASVSIPTVQAQPLKPAATVAPPKPAAPVAPATAA